MMRGRAWKPPKNFHEHVREVYDALAPSYDQDVGANPIGDRMRQVFRRTMLLALPSRGLVFEIGCGTGLEALWIAERGLEIVATDISGEMLEQVQLKAKTLGLSERVHCRRLAARGVIALREEFGAEAFDGGYSHAGALNMEPELRRVPTQLRTLLRKGGPFVCSVVNRTSLFELLFYLAVFRPRKAFRRLGGEIPIPISRREPHKWAVVPARFYTPAEVMRLFDNEFDVERVQGLQIFLPPSNLADHYAATRPVFTPLESLETRLSATWPLNSWGNHTIFTFRRR